MKISLIFLIIYMIGCCVITVLHEEVHVIIFDSYGIDSHVEYFSHFPPKAVTIPESPCPTEQCTASHNLNEIIGYPLMLIYGVFGLGLAILIMEKDL